MSMASVLDVDGTLAARWSLGFEDLALLNAKPVGTRLGLAAQLLMYRAAGRFARAASEFADAAITYLAEQVGAAVADLAGYDWLGRSGRRHRAEILAHLGFRRVRQQDMRDAAAWTGSELCPLGLPATGMMERLLGWFVEHRIVAPGEKALGALIVTARRTFEDKLGAIRAGKTGPRARSASTTSRWTGTGGRRAAPKAMRVRPGASGKTSRASPTSGPASAPPIVNLVRPDHVARRRPAAGSGCTRARSTRRSRRPGHARAARQVGASTPSAAASRARSRRACAPAACAGRATAG